MYSDGDYLFILLISLRKNFTPVNVVLEIFLHYVY